MEYACGVAGSKLIVVLGHEGCGAVKAACDNVELGNITSLLSNITPAVDAVRDQLHHLTIALIALLLMQLLMKM